MTPPVPETELTLPDPMRAEVGRRRLIQYTASGLAVVAAGPMLAACSSGSSSTGSSGATPSGTPKRGGTLKLGGQGGATTDTLDAHNPLTNTDNARVPQLYDALVRLDNKAETQLVLATSITPNANATEWTIVIRSGVVTHKGKPFTAKDVLFTFNRIVKNKFSGAIALGPVDLPNSKVVNDTTLLLKYKSPYAILVDALSLYFISMVPEGYDPKSPDGTGPFKYQSFTPGVQSTFVRNENYWQTGKPYLDAVVTTNIADETTQVNALQSGQVNVINFLSASSVAALKGAGKQVNVSQTGSWGPFTMRMDTKPYSNAKVRQALRLIVDRPQMLKQVFGGYGTIGNDVFGIKDPLYNTSLPQRVQDIPQAKSLLQSAGFAGLTVDLITTPNAPGQIQAAQVFATQAKAAGVNVKITNQNPTDYFAKSYLKVPFSQDYWPTQPYLVAAGQATVNGGPPGGAPYNATFQNIPAYNQAYASAIAEVDDTKRKALVWQMQQIEYDQGGNIIPYFFPTIDAFDSSVKGVLPTATGLSPGNFDYANFWIE